MAKLCSSYGSSPSSCSFFNDWMTIDELYNSEIGLIKPDPAELFEDLNLGNWPSIHSDIQKIESDNASICSALGMESFESDLKTEIRNIDCMWSGSTTLLSTSASSSYSDGITATAVPLAAVTGASQAVGGTVTIKQEPQQQPTIVVANNNKLKQQQPSAAIDIKQQIKLEINDDFEQKLQQHSIPNSKPAQQRQSMQHIPAGTSLLRKSNTQQQQQLQQKKLLQQQQTKYVAANNSSTIQIPKMYASEFLRERDQLLSTTTTAVNSNTTSTATAPATAADVGSSAATYLRPDTPHSLDDDATEFKHNVDLRACVMGSNNISLTADATHFINHVSQELQDTSKNQIDMRLVAGCSSLAEVLDVIVKDNSSFASSTTSAPTTSSSALSKTLHLRGSDCDSDEESSCGSAGSSMMDCDDLSYAATSPEPSQDSSSGSNSSHHLQQPYLHSDHSYTRCKDGMDDLGPNLETPSDSDEEIDVVSIGDKKLPTNPSDKDRRALQTKVAYKFSNARIVKTANGVRTIPPRRRISYDLPYTPASSSPVKSVATSRYPSPASTPYQNQYTTKYVQHQQHIMSMQADGTPIPINVISEKSRKRNSGGVLVSMSGASTSAGTSANSSSSSSSMLEYAMPPSKKQRGKKAKYHGDHNTTVATTTVAVSGGVLKRHCSLDEAADTIEKRNLHNDMERQRRIGLKNLFDALKKQIPSIKEKERAPKVNILREAAKLCESLVCEDERLTEQKAQLKEQLRKRQELLARLRAQQKD